MARRLFGTDGIRGTANTEPMTPETALKVAMAVGESLHNGAHKHLVVIGKDTRLSGYMLEPALTAGFITMGMDVMAKKEIGITTKEIGITVIAPPLACSWSTTLMECSIKVSRASRRTTAFAAR